VAEAPVAIVESVDWSLRAARFRWAELRRRIFEVDPLTCPLCQGLMRIVGVITEPAVITIPGYREVIVYYIDGWYYDQNGRGYPRAHEIVVFERDGRFYRRDERDRDGRDD
jgi:hypothetical protein